MIPTQKIATSMLLGLLALATSCTTFEDNAVATDPTVMGLEAEVTQQKEVVTQTKQAARSAEETLKAKESELDAARHNVRADEAVK
jgi:septal ring factor EnvC (AmiA/AmiB activator)